MRILIAEHSGFCYGVKRAVQLLDEVVQTACDDDSISVYTLGPIIHNDQVTHYYGEKGVKIVDKIANITDNKDVNIQVVIRSHGAAEDVYKEVEQKQFTLFDATCPYVKKIQNKVSTYALKGYNIIVVGDKAHPEVVGINGWCDNRALIVADILDLKPLVGPVCVVVQTTFNVAKWLELEKEIQSRYSEVLIFNTICKATEQRQQAASELAKKVDLMLVIGGKHSSNTSKLVKICSSIVRTIHIETKNDLKQSDWQGLETIGIVAGASTPDWVVENVVLKIENEGEVFF